MGFVMQAVVAMGILSGESDKGMLQCRPPRSPVYYKAVTAV